MNTRYPIKTLSIGCILTLLTCTGIFFYTHWKNQHFVAGLPQVPKSDGSQVPVEQKELRTHKHPGQIPPAATVASERLEGHDITPEVSDIEIEELVFEETDTSELDLEAETPSLSEIELPETLEEPPVEGIELEKTKVAWQDYNNLLATDPDFAYVRLAEGLREMYGDHPEIDIIVENIRRANDRTLTVDNAIDMMTATLKIMPADQTHVIDEISDKVELLYDLKALQAEGGNPTVTFDFHIGEE